MPDKTQEPNYSAPALEKGLDILELLASEPEGLTQKRVAAKLERTATEIFRMLLCLEKRGYITRSHEDDLYRLTPRLLELGHRYAPTHQLLEHAAPIMRNFAQLTGESCHLGILNGSEMQIIAQEDSPAYVGFVVRIGTLLPAKECTSGRVLLTWVEGENNEIRKNGYEEAPSVFFEGIVDLSFPIFDVLGNVLAALTSPVPFKRINRVPHEELLRHLREAAAQLSAELGYGQEPPEPEKPAARSA